MTALQAAGVAEENIFKEYASGKTIERKELKRMLAKLKRGDKVIVVKLDRISRSTLDLLELMNKLQAEGVEFQSLGDAIDTTTAQGKFFFTVTAAFSQMERELISERTKDGLRDAKERGIKVGRPPVPREKIWAIWHLAHDSGYTIPEACKLHGIVKQTYYKKIKMYGEPQ